MLDARLYADITLLMIFAVASATLIKHAMMLPLLLAATPPLAMLFCIIAAILFAMIIDSAI